ncbi:MAG: glycosyltransferase family protein [Pseudomonadales bacterium]|nr:glycosyltransferase family protein [Pseudomonadales bacterium]
MSKIIYGVSGEGSGHSSRAQEIINHLLARGHEIRVVSYDRGYRNLNSNLASPRLEFLKIEGLHIITHDNRIRPLQTVLDALRRLPSFWRRLQTLRKLFDDFQPDCVITDFEPSTAWLAARKGIPLISLDNQHLIRYVEYKAPLSMAWNRLVTRTIIRLMIPSPDVALVLSFFPGQTSNNRTFLFPPILRREVCALSAEAGDFHLVYVTHAYDSLLDTLKSFSGEKFLVYGYGRSDLEANLQFRPFSRIGFLQDLAACKSVIATAGFSLISEAIFLGKPYLALPMRGQFEQQLNALCLEQMGFGMQAAAADQGTLVQFFTQLSLFGTQLREARQQNLVENPDNESRALKQLLDQLLDQDLHLLRSYQLRNEPVLS